MKTKFYLTLIAVAVLSLLIIGCGEKNEVPSTEAIENAATDAKDKVEDMADKVEDTFASLKTEYLSKSEDLMSDVTTKYTELENKVNNLPRINKKPLEKPLELLEQSKTDVEEKFSALKDVNADNFETKKNEFESSMSTFTDRYDNLMDKF